MTFLSIINFYQISIANSFKEKFRFFLKIFFLKINEKILFVTKPSLVIFEKFISTFFITMGKLLKMFQIGESFCNYIAVEQLYENPFGRNSIARYTNISF